ncbi:MAG: hypothetical protein GY770_22360, partial [Aestuariibacter sp.]|nr:hypothetical protein [Aestuariibacter sp.]
MSNVAEIASAAREVSAEKLGTAVQKAQISILKMQIDTEAQIQLQLAAMLRE